MISKRVTIAEVAELAQVHKATVSRALNAATEHQVNAKTVKRIQRVAKQLGYSPNIMARGLRTNLSMTVGMIVPDLTNPIFPPILRGAENYLSAHGYTALIANTDGRDSLELAAFDSLLARRVDGLILASGQTKHPLLVDAHKRDIKVVLVNRGTVDVPYPLVTGDDAAGTTAAVDHLAQLGHRHILHLSGPKNFTTSLVRSAAFITGVSHHPGLHHEMIVAPSLSVEAGLSTMDAYLSSGAIKATAIIAGNDLLALGIIRSLRTHGIECPREISVVGFNDMPFAEDFGPPLTTVRVPHHEMGVESARLLLSGISTGVQSPVSVILPVSLIVRGSTAPPNPLESR
jgi:LacI family transcriptional regulator